MGLSSFGNPADHFLQFYVWVHLVEIEYQKQKCPPQKRTKMATTGSAKYAHEKQKMPDRVHLWEFRNSKRWAYWVKKSPKMPRELPTMTNHLSKMPQTTHLWDFALGIIPKGYTTLQNDMTARDELSKMPLSIFMFLMRSTFVKTCLMGILEKTFA